MNTWIKSLAGILMLCTIAGTIVFLARDTAADRFTEFPLPLKETYRLFDAGIVDANGDGFLDIYTTNHHFRQALLVADGNGGYHDVLSLWGLDQSPEFPLAELSFAEPVFDKAGLYIYWLGTQLVIRAHGAGSDETWQGSIRFNDPVEIVYKRGFSVEKDEVAHAVSETRKIYETVIQFSSIGDADTTNETTAKLAMRPGGQGLPIVFTLDNSIPVSRVFVGRGKVSPRASSFTLAMQDRHAMAWADYNSDGQLDIFIPRGALGGMLRAHPDHVTASVKDELLVSGHDGRYVETGAAVGISKRDCSGRHAKWLDFNNDGMLDIYVNCYDRESIEGKFPKQLYIQDEDRKFHDIAVDAGIGMPDQQLGSFVWIDMDNDGDIDLITFQDDGLFLHRNNSAGFSREPVFTRSLLGAERIGHTKGDHWNFDGKLSVADYDADGDLDIFSSSKRGNALLINDSGDLTPAEPDDYGLPDSSITANWVDYDNDGLVDLHMVPQGIYRQGDNHHFEATGLLEFPEDRFIAAICDWYDLDNNGSRDAFMVLSENHSYSRWWEFSKPKRRSSTWLVRAFSNAGNTNHWLQVELDGGPGNRQAIGAQVTVMTAGGSQIQEVGSTDGAFFSQGHYRLYFGLGGYATADTVKIRWSDGHEQEIRNVAADKLHIFRKDMTSLPKASDSNVAG